MKSYKLIILSVTFIALIFSCSKKDNNDDSTPCESNLLVDLGNDTTLYNELSFILDAGNPGASYLWSTGETTQTVEVTTSGNYWVKVTDECSETATDDINITFCYSVAVDLGNDTILTDGSSFYMNAGNPGAEYIWSTGETTQSIIVTEPGTYWVQVLSCGSTDSDTIIIGFNFRTIKIETDFGDIRIWLYNATPFHKDNFLYLTNQQFYDGLIFHRVVADFVIQGGDPDGTGFGGPGYTIPAEIIPGLSHVYGAVGAARLANNVNPDKESNGSQFYIVSDPDGETGLDGEYSVFGIVFNGINVVYDISLVPVDANSKPLEDVIMNEVVIEYFTAQELEDNFGFIIP